MLYIFEAVGQELKIIMFDFWLVVVVVVAAAHVLLLSWLWTLQVSAHAGVYLWFAKGFLVLWQVGPETEPGVPESSSEPVGLTDGKQD